MNLSVQHNKCSDKTYREKFGQGRHQSTSLLRGTISKMELLIKPPSLTGEQSAHARMHKCRWWRHEAHSNALVQGKDSLSYVPGATSLYCEHPSQAVELACQGDPAQAWSLDQCITQLDSSWTVVDSGGQLTLHCIYRLDTDPSSVLDLI